MLGEVVDGRGAGSSALHPGFRHGESGSLLLDTNDMPGTL